MLKRLGKVGLSIGPHSHVAAILWKLISKQSQSSDGIAKNLFAADNPQLQPIGRIDIDLNLFYK